MPSKMTEKRARTSARTPASTYLPSHSACQRLCVPVEHRAWHGAEAVEPMADLGT